MSGGTQRDGLATPPLAPTTPPAFAEPLHVGRPNVGDRQQFLGLARATADDLRGGDTAHNAAVVRRLLDGETGPVRDAVVLNAGAALAVYDGGVHDVVPAVASGMARAAEAIDSGRAKDALSRWVAACAAV